MGRILSKMNQLTLAISGKIAIKNRGGGGSKDLFLMNYKIAVLLELLLSSLTYMQYIDGKLVEST